MRQLDKPIPYSVPDLAMLLSFVAIVSYVAARLGTTVVISPHSDWTMWPGNILLSCMLLLVPRRIWPLVMAVALLVFGIYDLRLGLSLRTILFFQFSDAIETLTAACGLRYAFGGPPVLNSLRALGKYVFFAVLLAPFTGAFFGAATSHGEYPTGWGIAFLSQSLGYLTLMPAIFGWINNRFAWRDARLSRYLEALALIVGLMVLGYFSLVAPSSIVPAVLTIVPFLLWAALRFGTTGVSTATIAVAFLAVWGALHGRGPFVAPQPAANVPPIQVFLLFVAAPFMVLAVLAEEDQQTKRELAHERSRLIEAQEEERTRIARELHDDFCQRLAMLSLKMEKLRDAWRTSNPPLVDAQLDSARQECADLAGDVQQMSHTLHPSILDNLGLAMAVKSLCREVSEQSGAIVEFTDGNTPDCLPREVALSLFRVVQEALRNAVKYSGQKQFEVRLHATGAVVELEVSDRGVGFDVAGARKTPGLGLISMRERVHLVNGTIRIDSRPNAGTRIRVSVPFVAPSNALANNPPC
ncbi:MAG TPA: MASE1 domain-containing protein [Verrucomicrobiae bacterium]|nr:MASE1 domain-containing protein [Verrucomicrobiae bacterium]